MVRVPELIVLDVNETLSDLSDLRTAFSEEGLEQGEAETWFSTVLRDGFALTVLGDNPSFADIGRTLLTARLTSAGVSDPTAAAERVMGTFGELTPHPDVVPGLQALADLGCRIITLSNGSADVARALLGDTEADHVVEDYLAVADAGAWKPASSAYAYALRHTGVAAADAMLVAVHPWDVAGATRAGLRTAWIKRRDTSYPDHFDPPELAVPSLTALADSLRRRR